MEIRCFQTSLRKEGLLRCLKLLLRRYVISCCLLECYYTMFIRAAHFLGFVHLHSHFFLFGILDWWNNHWLFRWRACRGRHLVLQIDKKHFGFWFSRWQWRRRLLLLPITDSGFRAYLLSWTSLESCLVSFFWPSNICELSCLVQVVGNLMILHLYLYSSIVAPVILLQ